MDPTEVVERGWFGYPIPWQRNAGFRSPRPTLGNQSYGHALGLHAYTKLRFPAADADARLLATIGIEQPAPEIAAAAVTVRVGDSVAASKPELRPRDGLWKLDVAVPAGSAIELEVDFGPNEDVGDRIIFANPRLLLNAAAGGKK
jgi:hypothetical protein